MLSRLFSVVPFIGSSNYRHTCCCASQCLHQTPDVFVVLLESNTFHSAGYMVLFALSLSVTPAQSKQHKQIQVTHTNARLILGFYQLLVKSFFFFFMSYLGRYYRRIWETVSATPTVCLLVIYLYLSQISFSRRTDCMWLTPTEVHSVLTQKLWWLL